MYNTQPHKGSYNGWKNWATWNVALWIGNDESLYLMAKASDDYADFVEKIDQLWTLAIFSGTLDGVAWTDDSLDISALNELIEEL